MTTKTLITTNPEFPERKNTGKGYNLGQTPNYGRLEHPNVMLVGLAKEQTKNPIKNLVKYVETIKNKYKNLLRATNENLEFPRYSK